MDEIEQLAIDRAKAIFGAEHANLQPYSGSNPNTAVYLAMLEPGDTVMGMSLARAGIYPTVIRGISPASSITSCPMG